jgi:Flp pilus assembly protein TadG
MLEKHENTRRGTVLIWVALCLLLLVGFVGLASDTGLVMLAGNELQNASDAAALAGAQFVRSDQDLARQMASDIGLANETANTNVVLALNGGNAADGDIVVGYYDRDERTFTPTTDAPNAVKVVARRTADAHGAVPLVFGPTFNVNDANVVRSAIAMVGGGTGAGLIALCGDCPCALRVSGTVDVSVNDGDIQVNSDDDCAVCGNGNPVIDTPNLNINGGNCFNGGVGVTGDINTGSSTVPDPLAFLPDPSWNSGDDLGSINVTGGTQTFQPGFYSGGINLNGGSTTFAPGIYVVDGAGLDIGGNANVFAEETMFFIIGSGNVNINGTGSIHITPPSSGIYEGVTFFQARDNSNESVIIGTGSLDLQGTLYFPNAPVEIGGTGDGIGNQLIAYTIWLHGNGDLTINYDGSFPAPGNTVFLVE